VQPEPVIVRPYQPGDRAAVRRICFDTGFMGDSIGPQYGDRESYADMFTSYFTDVEPENAFVAVMGDEVVGYSLNVVDARKAWNPMLVAMKHAVTRLACFRPGTFGFYVRCCLDMVADLGKRGRPAFDWNVYPSTCHVNILPQGRNGTVGRDLMYHAFDRLKLAGSPGLHGEAFSINTRTIKFWQKTLGLTLVGDPYPIPGLRTPQGERLTVMLGMRTLDTWNVGAWKEQAASAPASRA
jgi:hypothetical protein